MYWRHVPSERPNDYNEYNHSNDPPLYERLECHLGLTPPLKPSCLKTWIQNWLKAYNVLQSVTMPLIWFAVKQIYGFPLTITCVSTRDWLWVSFHFLNFYAFTEEESRLFWWPLHWNRFNSSQLNSNTNAFTPVNSHWCKSWPHSHNAWDIAKIKWLKIEAQEEETGIASNDKKRIIQFRKTSEK